MAAPRASETEDSGRGLHASGCAAVLGAKPVFRESSSSCCMETTVATRDTHKGPHTSAVAMLSADLVLRRSTDARVQPLELLLATVWPLAGQRMLYSCRLTKNSGARIACDGTVQRYGCLVLSATCEVLAVLRRGRIHHLYNSY